jgi:hypothetical protein
MGTETLALTRTPANGDFDKILLQIEDFFVTAL